ncbi:hypothetical protein EV122DRAFT_263833 [Schizophyllum commune]
MTRRWKKSKSARYAATASVQRRVPSSYRDKLSTELWHLIFSQCTPLTLLAARDACRLFRDIIDRKDGEMLARAPLLLSPPPPDPRRFMRYVKTAAQYEAIREVFDIKDVDKPGAYGSATYTKVLFGPGLCYACGKLTHGPPMRILGRIYVCSKGCRRHVLRKHVVHLIPEFNYLPAHSMHYDRHIVPWLPTISISKKGVTQTVLKRDLGRARTEYRNRIQIMVLSQEERRSRSRALFSEYHVRHQRTKALTDVLSDSS